MDNYVEMWKTKKGSQPSRSPFSPKLLYPFQDEICFGVKIIKSNQMRIVLILAIFLYSCNEETFFHSDPKLESYVVEFYLEAQKHGHSISRENLIVKSSNSIGAKSGMFETSGSQRIVHINSYVVDSENELRKKIVVFHELGHALLNRDHIDSHKSIMNTSACINCPIDEYYLNELFD